MPSIDDFMAAFNEFTGNRDFGSLEGLDASLAEFSDRANRRRLADFGGLSPEQVQNMLYHPFDGTGSILTIGTDLDSDLVRAAPIMNNLRIVLEHFAERGTVRATAKGYLARESAQALHRALAADTVEQWFLPHTECASGIVHWFRRLLQDVGWLKLRKGRFSLTKAGWRIANDGITGAHYHELLRHYCTQFNWAFRDLYPEMQIIQLGFLFALFLARGNTDSFAPVEELANRFLQAFPASTHDVPSTSWQQPEESFHRAFRIRFVLRFAEPFGLFVLQPPGSDYSTGKPLAYRVTPLYRQMLLWDR